MQPLSSPYPAPIQPLPPRTEILPSPLSSPCPAPPAQVCEELWAPASPHVSLALAGVDIFTNGSGSHHELRKLQVRPSPRPSPVAPPSPPLSPTLSLFPPRAAPAAGASEPSLLAWTCLVLSGGAKKGSAVRAPTLPSGRCRHMHI